MAEINVIVNLKVAMFSYANINLEGVRTKCRKRYIIPILAICARLMPMIVIRTTALHPRNDRK